MKITIFELLGLVKDGKAPKRFKYDSYVWTYNYESSAYWNGKGTEFEDYMDDGLMKYLNDEVEIIEEEKKIPEKLNLDKDELRGKETPRAIDYLIESKINQVIDYLKSKGDE